MSSYWFQDLNILFDTNRLDEFVPKRNMTHAEKTNAIMRGALYLGIFISIIQSNYLFLYIPIIVGLISIILYYYRKVDEDTNNKINEIKKKYGTKIPINDNTVNFNNKSINNGENNISEGFKNNCSSPQKNNPFMNPLPFDNRERPQACNYTTENKKKIEAIYNKNLFKEVGDIFNKKHGNRQFYTVPSTTYPNNQGDFGKWLYGTPKTCKEGNGNQCVANNMERLNGQSYQFPFLY